MADFDVDEHVGGWFDGRGCEGGAGSHFFEALNGGDALMDFPRVEAMAGFLEGLAVEDADERIAEEGNFGGIAGLDQRTIPRFELTAGGSRFECRISLTQNATISFPELEILVFHVEHPPVDKPPPFTRARLDKAMNTGVDHVNGH